MTIIHVTAAVALAGIADFVVIVVALHFVQPGYDPRHQLMSELALGHSVLPMGIGQRLAAACLLLWLVAVAVRALMRPAA